MFKRLNELSFVIGVFFTIVSLVLLATNVFDKELPGKLNLYTGVVFLIFGLFMISVKSKKDG
jgi:uncharacterized membrane protein HdeD (DUF308 family)